MSLWVGYQEWLQVNFNIMFVIIITIIVRLATFRYVALLAANNLQSTCPIPALWHLPHCSCGMIHQVLRTPVILKKIKNTWKTLLYNYDVYKKKYLLTDVVICVCVIAMQTKAAVPVMVDLMEALVAALQQIGRLEDRPCRFRVTGSAGNLLYS